MSTSLSPLSVGRTLAQRGVAYPQEIASAARANGLDPSLLAAVAAQETGGPGSNAGRNIVGDAGHGHGVFQIDDRWHTFASTPAAANPQANADYAAGMLAGLIKQYGGNVHAALSAYNSGSPNATGTLTTWQDGERLGYADSVLRHYQQIAGAADPQVSDPSSLQTMAASFPLSAPPPLPDPNQTSYRQVAGLNDNGQSTRGGSSDLGSIVDPDDASSDSNPFDF